MAAVYLARHRTTGRLVAIKAIRARYLDDPDAVRRFTREARTVAGLDHPNIVRTEAIEQFGDRAVAIIMEHVPGGTVRERLREFGSLGAEDAESILRDVAKALAYAHSHGIVHRDVKPENIFLDATRRRALLSDFGIARPIDTDAGITLLGAALGTPQYMSPEQIDGEVVDGRSDIYSLGVLGWELLTGRRPWAGESLYGIIYKQKHEDLPRITSLRPRVPANLLFAIEGALIKDRNRRWQSIDDFLDQLTYSPPPLLSQTFPPGATRGGYEPTVRFRRDDPPHDALAASPPNAHEVASAVEGEPRHETPTLTSPAVIPPGAVAEALLDDPASPAVAAPAAAAAVASEPPVADFDPNSASSFEFPSRRRRILQVVGLLVPLGVAAASLFVLLSGSTRESPRVAGSPRVTSSAGSVAEDSITPRGRDGAGVMMSPAAEPRPTDGVVTGSSTAAARPAATITPRVPRKVPAAASTRIGASTTAPPPAPAGPLPRMDSGRAVAAVRPPEDSAGPSRTNAADAPKTPTATIDDPFRIPPSGRDPGALGAGSVPSPRCRLASAADQDVCLTAYIARGDVSLNRALESLVDEMRRVAHTPPGAPDPATVQRIRLEQRAWISIRNSECPRKAPMGAGPFWAEAQADCFAEMATARTAELRDAVKRLRRNQP
jgi:uncharacterized protein YecT (DUF1311 family)